MSSVFSGFVPISFTTGDSEDETTGSLIVAERRWMPACLVGRAMPPWAFMEPVSEVVECLCQEFVEEGLANTRRSVH